jgi:2-dehydro-3-deoxy-D-gluconate 5-dehydrogenase
MTQSVLKQFTVTDRIALVTGASAGLGQAMALGLAEAGAHVAVIARAEKRLESVTAAIQALGRKVLPVVCNVADKDAVEAMVRQVRQHFGRIDILVNNAGITLRNTAEKFTDEEWHNVIDVNLNAVFYMCRAVGRIMLEQQYGKIINIASLLSFSGGITVQSYAAAKGGVAQLTKALANEWASRGVNVNAIAPGYFRTELTEALQNNPERNPGIVARIPAGDWGVPDQLKGSVVYLASDASSYTHGHILTVDGGWMAR